MDNKNSQIIESKAQLIESLEQGAKAKNDWTIGTEHEKFAYRTDDFGPLPYEGERGIRALLEGLQRFGWRPILEEQNIIAISRGRVSQRTVPATLLESNTTSTGRSGRY